MAKREKIVVRMGHSISTVILRKSEFTFFSTVDDKYPQTALSFKD